MSASLNWTVSLDDRRVAVEATGMLATEVLRYVAATLTVDETPAEPLLRLCGDDVVSIFRDGLQLGVFERVAAAEVLMRELAALLVWEYANGLALHAAMLDTRGKAFLFAAKSGSGKSTLAVCAAVNGWGFHTDELVLIPARGSLHALNRPAHLKVGSMFVLDAMTDMSSNPDVWRNQDGALIAPSLLAAPTPQPELHALVFPEFEPGASVDVQKLSAGRATFALLGAVVNARNLPHDGVPRAKELASRAPAYAVRYGDASKALSALQELG